MSYHDDHDDDNVNDGHDDYVGVADIKSRDDGYIDETYIHILMVTTILHYQMLKEMMQQK